jgi:putative DNA primase/helicase
MLWLYGPSGTGKSTFIKVVNNLLGPAAVAIGSEKFTEYTLAQLAGMRVAIASELSPRTMRTSLLKALIAGDPMQARHPYGRPFDMVFKGKLVWSSNAMPPLDQSEGMRRRINVVEFNQVPSVVDVYLEAKLEAELPGILNWAVVGAQRLLKLREQGSSDWTLPYSVKAFVDQYMESADPTAQFFQEEVELVEGFEFPAIEIYQRYVQWAKERQIYVESWGPAFYRAMSNYGLEPAPDRIQGKRVVKIWRGGRLVAGNISHYTDEV